ncbi:neuronal acetylcholine receptor subunit alpha-7-like isoform X2 [Xenia sp. Carnegie-2017]|uniref:neuronal acetylcholine receptor subunit alpha-7-like isoform X2 n=1 Tax=Xenia sp. Carnegie-2017 TaxID=2897299 RepID=UPI001F0487BF|nr:neuronal acetylcholine receptor subunit alpha-7-like isoform X2 [Xenia sp. Carnegie-2017]
MHLDNGLLIPLFVFLLCKGNLVNGNNEKARLIKDLLKNYCPDARPFDNYSSSYNNNSRPFKNDFRPVKVYFSLTYHQLQDFNEPAQIAKSLVWIRTYWTDINLKWNASEYGGNEHVHISAEKIWIPDLTLYNSANGEGEKMYDLSYQARVQSNGNVSLASPLLLESICHINLKDFPFDAQKCELRIGSWTYDSSDLDLKIAPSTKGIIMDHLETNSLWHYKHKSAKSPSSDAGSIPMDLQEETNSTNLQEEISTENNDSWEYDIFSFYFFLGVFGIFFIVILIYAV